MGGKRLRATTQAPRFGRSTSVVISHKEFVQDISLSATGQFLSNTFVLQPGLQKGDTTPPSPFTWLPPIAAQFEEYQWLGLLFTFKSTASFYTGSSTSPALGQVIMATQYNAGSPAFTSKESMEQYEGATSGTVTRSMVHGVEVARRGTPVVELYTRNAAVPSGQDPRLYDFGNFTIATQGGASTGAGIVGELWVSYKIKLLKPKINPTGANQGGMIDHFVLP